MYNVYGQSSGIMCPAGSSSAGDITGKNAGRYEIRNLNENQFHFKSVDMSPDESTIVVKKSKKNKKNKKDKK